MNSVFINTILLTKDGRIIGNAIVVGIRDGRVLIKTDYGNYTIFPIKELETYFYIDGIAEKDHKHFVSIHDSENLYF